jgi:hypothetical protein
VAGSDLERKLRENEGRRLWPDFKRSLVAAIGSDIADERLSLAETGILRESFVARLRGGRNVSRVVDRPSLDEILVPLDAARQRAGTLDLVLLHPFDRSIGGVRVPSQAILKSPERVLGLLKGDLYVTTDGAQDGVALQITTRHASPTADRNEYSLALWGRFAAFESR